MPAKPPAFSDLVIENLTSCNCSCYRGLAAMGGEDPQWAGKNGGGEFGRVKHKQWARGEEGVKSQQGCKGLDSCRPPGNVSCPFWTPPLETLTPPSLPPLTTGPQSSLFQQKFTQSTTFKYIYILIYGQYPLRVRIV